MVKLLVGHKGSGKTKRIIDAANDRARTTKGSIIYITDCVMINGTMAKMVYFHLKVIRINLRHTRLVETTIAIHCPGCI